MDALIYFKIETCQSETQDDESNVTVPVGSETSKIPERASHIDRIKSRVTAVLSVEGANCSDSLRGTRYISSVRYSTCTLVTKSALKPGEVEILDV